MKRYQFVWSSPFKIGMMREFFHYGIGKVYRWVLFLGWLEIRRWK
jgi:hypothetical protein